MIQLISRSAALKNEVLASYIGGWQEAIDPRRDPYVASPEEGISQAELDKLQQKRIEEYLQLRDDIQPKPFEFHGEIKYNLPLRELHLYPKALGKTLEKLSKALQSDLFFLLDYGIPWLSQDHDFPAARAALTYLKEQGMSENFAGAIQANGEELSSFVSHLFWISRCCASLPHCYFSTDQHAFVGSICKYGNLHLYTYSAPVKLALQAFATQNQLIELDQCVEAFSASGGIEGRQIKS